MKSLMLSLSCMFWLFNLSGQDISQGLIANDLLPHPMQALSKPAYLQSVIDPSFGTTIRRISDAQPGENIRTMYSTVQAWNADETRLILYKRPGTGHILLDGFTYEFIRDLDINPTDIEQVFWHFEDPDVLYYMDASTRELIRYNVSIDSKTSVADLRAMSACTEGMTGGNDAHTMSWDSDVFTFRCGNSSAWAYRISTNTITEILVDDVAYTAPMPFPSGTQYYHRGSIYNADGTFKLNLDISSGAQHSSIGRDDAGNDFYFAVSFAQSPSGGCVGEVIAYDPSTGDCTEIVGTGLGYAYPQSGTHLSALTHKNSDGGWLVAGF